MLEDLAWIRYGYCHYGAAFACSLNLRFPGIIPAFARGYISIPLCGTRICQDRPLSDYLIQGQHRRSGSHRQAPGHQFCTLLDSENPWWSVVFCSICMVWVFIGFIIFFFFCLYFPSIFDTHCFELSEGANLHLSSVFGYYYLVRDYPQSAFTVLRFQGR